MPVVPDEVDAEKLLDVPMITVTGPAHALARRKGLIRLRELKQHVQLVLTDRTTLTAGRTFGVFSPLIIDRLQQSGAHDYTT